MNIKRMLITGTLLLLAMILLTFDVRARLFEDGSIRITACIPYTMCSLPYVEPDIEALTMPDYGEVTLPTDHY